MVEVGEYLVECLDHLLGFQFLGQGSEPDDVGEEHARGVIVLGDGSLLIFQDRGDALRQDVEQQSFRLLSFHAEERHRLIALTDEVPDKHERQ